MPHIYHLIDVRTPGEYAVDNIDGSVNIPMEDLLNKTESALATLASIPKDMTVHVYCASGGRAEFAKRLLESMGYLLVINLGSTGEAKKYSETNKLV